MKKLFYLFIALLISQNKIGNVIINSMKMRVVLLLLCSIWSQQLFSQSLCGTWSSSTAYPTNLVGTANVALGSNIYVFSGYNGVFTSDSKKFNGTTWSAIAKWYLRRRCQQTYHNVM
ncbi:hypothetical protein VB796_20755 [Arcicella sp. LKC2W]|uniref:hypothetical protein n=1 Tax=Arcicella sp. LKC2W TaxID=2984198 RepID=UPI002B1FE1FC|nr:hypothetical protein [Arcicella sp. LKC2W]MEA5461509.1 hypothetical protein [Arcicella sp. LKC2W]